MIGFAVQGSGRTAQLTGLFVAAAVCVVAAQTPASALVPLQGRWVVASAEHGGKPFDAITGGVMTITGERFEIRTATGTVLQGTLRLETSTVPYRMDMVHADGARWEGIYEVSGDTFRLNYVDVALEERRPEMFATSETTEATIIVLRRENR